jgi:signal transduction histidine kinase
VLPRLWERDPDEGRRLAELRQLTRGALAEMRTLLLELRPAALTEAGLGDLLRQLAEAVTGRSRIPVVVTVDGECALTPDVRVALYRIAQEALNNVAKHSGASEAAVTLSYCHDGSSAGVRNQTAGPGSAAQKPGSQVELCIRDSGSGFHLEGIRGERLGLRIMRERAESIGAALSIESRAGQGTRVQVVWPAPG